jgi:phospholipid/cholesterol/gamma-HCH transport system substrate-binding protein
MAEPEQRVHYIHRISKSVQQRIVGIFVLAAVLVIAGLVLVQIRVSHLFDDRVDYQTFLSNAQGVSTETLIKISGIDVGQVTSIDITEENRIHVRFFVYESFQRLIRTDSTGELSKLSVIGNTSIIITAGDASLPIMPGGSTIKVAEPLTVDDLMAEVAPILERIDGIIRNVSDIIAAIEPEQVRGASDNLFQTTQNLRKLSEQINEGQGVIGRLVYDEQLADDLARPVQEAGPVVANVNRIVQDLASDMQLVESILQKTESRIEELAGVIEPAQQAASGTADLVDELKITSVGVNRDLEQLPELIDKMRRLLESTNETIDAAQRVWPLSTVIPEPGDDTVIREQPLDE